MVKKVLGMMICLCLLCVSVACAAQTLTDGVYTASSAGLNGDVTVNVTIEGGAITDVSVTEHQETEGIGTNAVDQLPAAIVEAQSVDVDAVGGATVTSNAIKAAVADCLVQAGGDVKEVEVTAGTFEGQGMGMRGVVKVAVTVDENGAVTDIEITDHKETIGIYEKAFEQVPQQIIAGQTLNVDSVSGATLSSAAIRTAVRDALSKAGLDAQFASAPAYATEKSKATDLEADVVVVGGGLAGIMTAYKASQDGASVIIVEKTDLLGGSLPRSAGMMFSLSSQIQADAGFVVPEEGEYAPENTFANTFMYHASGAAVDAMSEMGIEFVDIQPTILTFAPQVGRGSGYVALALREVIANSDVQVLYHTVGTKLVSEEGVVTGIEVTDKMSGETFTVSGKAVVLTTGGWSNNEELIARYQPEAVDAKRGGNFYATGDGHVMAEEIGAGFVNMEAGNLAFAISPRTYQYLTFALNCGILVGADGQRFINEQVAENYTLLDAAVLQLPDYTFYMVFDTANAAFCSEDGLIDSLAETGAAHVYGSLEELAEGEGIANLMETVERYNAYCEAGEDADFGRQNMLPISLDDTTYYCIQGTIGYYSSLGGIDVDTACHVLDTNGAIIPGLYAAGEVTGNCYYHDLGYYGGGLGTAYAMGWVAGETAAADIK